MEAWLVVHSVYVSLDACLVVYVYSVYVSLDAWLVVCSVYVSLDACLVVCSVYISLDACLVVYSVLCLTGCMASCLPCLFQWTPDAWLVCLCCLC